MTQDRDAVRGMGGASPERTDVILAETVAVDALSPSAPGSPQTDPAERRVPRRTVALIFVGAFGAGLALVVPMAYSMALRLADLAPGQESVLGYILGIGAVCSLVAAPLTGIISDRTRSRWGRRRPFTVLGVAIGLAAVPVLAFAPNIPVLTAGWLLTSIGWGTAGGSIGNLLADTLPERQRGQVSGLVNLAGQVAPVLGILLAGLVTGSSLLLFLVPALLGALMVLAFALFVHEGDSRHLRFADALTVARFVLSLAFDPRRHPAFAWAWVGRFLFFFGLSLTIPYGTYFYSQRLGVPVEDVATVMAAISAVGIAAASVGALGAGWISDRWGSRRMWTATAAALFAVGCIVSALSWTLPGLIAGAMISNVGIAAFGSVGQALVLDVMPHRETQAGRFSAIIGFSQRIPSAVAPLAAPLVMSLAPVAEARYTVLYLASGALAVVGGIVTATMVRFRG
ncbi:MFS transporter [Agromyces kandeliae]|uniref:MFS transporter n=1 Tax=Agromyces kandeliae TaxID=2666141 RepID=A0A6L5R6Q2_9MICO|nr:MFS transporter [Agromyces kandeliae]MRX45214.1 MFS transporter [Agromyces kandeliae]